MGRSGNAPSGLLERSTACRFMTKARRGRNGRADKDARHVRLYHWVLGSEAWQSLNPNARAAYIELASKYAGVGSNNGRIGCSVRQIANALHIGKATAQKALADLQERGFIVAMQKGALEDWDSHGVAFD